MKAFAPALCAAVLACAPASAQIAGKRWVFTQIGAERLDAQARARTSFAFDTKSSLMSASAGCNRIGGVYALQGASLSFSRMLMTRMACPPPLDARERALADALRSVASWKIERGALTLNGADGAPLLHLAPQQGR